MSAARVTREFRVRPCGNSFEVALLDVDTRVVARTRTRGTRQDAARLAEKRWGATVEVVEFDRTDLKG